MTTRQRNLISRGTAIVFGVAMLWGGVKLIPTTIDVADQLYEMGHQPGDSRRERQRARDASSAVWWPAIGLLAIGGGLTAFGVVGEKLFATFRK
jgi:hypothetical protein